MNEKQKLSRTLVGEVLKHQMNKTIVVTITRQVKHPSYGKYVRRLTKIHAHDEQNVCHKGDVVMIKECRPYSKTKNWVLVEVLEKNAEN